MTETDSSTPAPRGFPRWAMVLGGLVVVLILFALAVPYFMNVDHYRTDIANALEQQTGRTVTLGKIQARVIPEIGVVIDDFHVGNPKNFPAGDLVSADEIRANVALAPLLHGTIHVKSFELVHPKLTILTDDKGANNYTFASAAPAASAKSAPSGGSSSGMALDQIDNIVLSNIEVMLGSVAKDATVPSATAKGISVTLHNFVVTPMTIHAWNAESNLAGVELALGGWSAPITFTSGKLTLDGGKLDAQFIADLAKASEIRGTLNVPDVEHPQVNFEISSPKMDIDALIASAGGSSTSTATPPSGTPPTAANPTGAPAAPGELVARGHINIESISSKPYTVGPANAEIRVYTDRAELWPISVGMYGGTLQVSSRVDRVTNPPRFTANVQMRNLDVAKVLESDPTAKGKMSGTGELDLMILGALTDSWKKTVSGTGKFAVRNGTLPGVNLGGAAGSLAKLTGMGGSTSFSVLQGDVSIASQRVGSKQIHLDSTIGTVDLKGSVGMDETLDYEGVIALTPGGGGAAGNVLGVVGGLLGNKVGKISVPFALAGTVEHPSFKPGKGIPSFAGAGGPTTASAPAGQPAAPPNPVDTLKSLFKKH
jgi:hypothetical protein